MGLEHFKSLSEQSIDFKISLKVAEQGLSSVWPGVNFSSEGREPQPLHLVNLKCYPILNEIHKR